MTGALKDEYRERILAAAGQDPWGRRDAEERLGSIPFPDSLPAYRRLRIDEAGMLWVQEYDLPGATHNFTRRFFERYHFSF